MHAVDAVHAVHATHAVHAVHTVHFLGTPSCEDRIGRSRKNDTA